MILITGAASGIGKYLAENIEDSIPIDIKYGVDVSNYTDVKENLGYLDGENIEAIINCAGIKYESSFEESSYEEFDRIIECNVSGIFVLAKYFLDELKKSKGCIINISSVHAVSTLPECSLYAMTKGAIESLTRGMAIDLSKHGIRVNCIRPGPIDTPMLEYTSYDESKVPLKRIGKPENILSTINYILENDYITGSCITVDGGVLSRLSIDI